MEELTDALHLKESPDYSLSLGQITKGLHEIGARLDAIETHPALRLAPGNFADAIERAGNGVRRGLN